MGKIDAPVARRVEYKMECPACKSFLRCYDDEIKKVDESDPMSQYTFICPVCMCRRYVECNNISMMY